jgi:hypothetical protein
MSVTRFRELGIAVIPVIYRTKTPDVSSWRKYQSAQPTESEMARWFRSGRQVNAAVICGWQGLTVIDFDLRAAQPEAVAYVQWQWWATWQGGIARDVALRTYRVRTSRGMHVYLFVSDRPRCGHFPGGDVKGQGGYVLIPPSVHPSGAVYTAVDDAAPILSVDSLDQVLPEPPPPPMPQPLPLVHVADAASLWPQPLVEEVKAATPILSLLPGAEQTDGSGRWWIVRCPLHDDKTPSMWVDATRGLCGCYSGCTPRPLDSVDLYARLHGLSNTDAIRDLAKRL